MSSIEEQDKYLLNLQNQHAELGTQLSSQLEHYDDLAGKFDEASGELRSAPKPSMELFRAELKSLGDELRAEKGETTR